MGDKSRGLYGKFHVERADGKSAVGEKHDGCDYFVLDLTHDLHMVPALVAYAESASRDGYHLLAADIVGRLMKSPAYSAWHSIKFNQLSPRLRKFLRDAARSEMDMNRA